MDGARLANALATTGEGLADVTWRAGVDALSFGFVKNGGLNAEALILFKTELADEIAVRRKRAGHLLSKGRYPRRADPRNARRRPVARQCARRQCRRADARPGRARAAGLSGRSQRDFPEGHVPMRQPAALPGLRLLRLGPGRNPAGDELGPAGRGVDRLAQPSPHCEAMRHGSDISIAIPFIIFTAIWGSTWIVIRDQLGTVPPQWSVTYRFAIAAIAMAAVARWKGESLRFGRRAAARRGVLGFFQFGVNFNAVYLAEQHITSGVVATVFALLLIPNSLLAWAFLGQRQQTGSSGARSWQSRASRCCSLTSCGRIPLARAKCCSALG